MRVVGIVQARMTSTRLPGKVLLPLGRTTVIDAVLTRLAAAAGIDAVCVAVPEGDGQAQLAEHLGRNGAVTVVRGPEQDVLARYCMAARATDATHIVRVTSDCPLIDPRVISAIVAAYKASGAAYVSTALSSGYPIGFDTEMFAAQALREADEHAHDPYEREHVTPFLWRRPERFPALYLDRKPDRRSLRLTVDTPEDYEVARRLYERLGKNPLFGLEAIEAAVAADPGLMSINRNIVQKPYETI